MQSPVMPSPLGGDFFFSEGEIAVGGDVIDESPKAFYEDVSGYMSLVQDLY